MKLSSLLLSMDSFRIQVSYVSIQKANQNFLLFIWLQGFKIAGGFIFHS